MALVAATLDDGARGLGVEPAAHSASVINGLSLLLQLELRCMEETELLIVRLEDQQEMKTAQGEGMYKIRIAPTLVI